jgi:heat shock protein HslJ
LANAEYQSEYVPSGTVKLDNGEYREPAAPGSATEIVVQLTGYIAYGELNGQPVAAVVLVTNPGGSGNFYDLAVMVDVNGSPVNIASISLGDRVQINGIAIENNAVVVDMVTHGPDDPMCCPTQHVVNTYALHGDQLVLQSSVQADTLAQDDEMLAASIGIQPSQIGLSTEGLPYSWQANLVAGTPYDESQPPGPSGLPDHIQINFGVTDAAQVQPQDPIVYIVPVDAYQDLWDAAGNSAVTDMINAIYWQMTVNPYPAPTSGMPALPYEQVVGTNDLAVQVGTIAPTGVSASKNGYRFVGRFAQSPNPVTNSDLRYIYQGFSNDGKYLVLFFYPVSTSQLPNTASEVPQAEMDQVAANPTAYLAAKTTELNALPSAAWEPDLGTLDALIRSLTIVNMPPNGIEGLLWQLTGTYDGYTELPLDNTQNYTVAFYPKGRLDFKADCNSGQGIYAASGGMVGSLATELGPITLAECGPGSYSDVMIATLQAAQNYKVRPGGQLLELVRPAGGGSLLFRAIGPIDATPPQPEQPPIPLPTPEPQGAYARVTAPDGVNLRSGPGTNYPVVGIAPYGAEGPVVGRSVDGQWWVVSAPNAPGGVVWASASYVEAFNTEGVPVIPAPILVAPTPSQPTPIPPQAQPVATVTPIPTPIPPTPTPMPQVRIDLSADPTVIDQGECTTLSWDVENVQAVWVYPLGEPYEEYPVTGQGSRQECPAYTTTYEMRVLLRDDTIELRQVTVTVNTTNPLAYTNWTPITMNGEPVIVANNQLMLSFDESVVSGNGGCNSFNGGYTVNGSMLSIGPLATTRLLCGNEAMDQQEMAYLTALQSAASFTISEGQLILFGNSGSELLRLNPID